MQIYKTPLKEMKFLINNFVNLSFFNSIQLNHDISDLEMVLEEAAKICEDTLLPLNQSGDIEGCIFNNGKVQTPKGFKEAYKIFSDNGWQGIKVSEKYGGQNLPYFINMFIDEIVSSTNMSFGLYPGLTTNAIEAIENSATDELKKIYLPKLTSGEWTGTMNLTESQCGTDLGLSKSIAIPQNDGSYKLTGTKIFITCGEHDLSKNIIHLVLARTPNAPPGIKGISLFLVPKIIPNKDGSLGELNNLQCGSIEKKMGINASPTCVMHYNNAKGWIVGDLNKGMKSMFVMMNGARLFVGIQGLGISEIAYQSALYYSKERLQGKSSNKLKKSENLADPIIVHPEIRKNLIRIKSLNEGLRGLMFLTGLQIDISKNDPDLNKKQTAEDWVAIMTPVLKSFSTDFSFESANNALQIYGGHGYIKEHGIEQFVRDSRITAIYEGTNGIQAIDLVNRKMKIDNGRLINNFLSFVKKYINVTDSNLKLKSFLILFKESLSDLEEATNYILKCNKDEEDEILGIAVEYLKLLSLVSVGYVWLRFMDISFNNDDNSSFYKSKIATGRFYFSQILSETKFLKLKILSGSKLYNEYNDNYFDLGI